jgi:hypothetical protein
LLNIKFWNFAKKNNSTKIPSGNWTELQCELKDECSMLAPVIRLRNAATSVSWNYCYIPGFGRYYFINDWRWINGCWEASCSVDVLGSWKQEIGSESMYILRHNSTTDFNGLITDTIYPATNNYSTINEVLPGSWAPSIQGGIYILGVMSSDDTRAVGAISYFAMTSAQFGDLKDMLFSDNNLITMGLAASDGHGGITPLVNDMSMEVLKTMYNPYQYIVSCIWLPLGISDISHSAMETTLKIGWWDYTLDNYPIFAQQLNLLNMEYTTIPEHPQAATRGEYLNYAPYTRISVFGRFGTVAIDNSYLKAGWRLNFSYYVDVVTGQCRVEINTWDPNLQNPYVYILAERTFLLGVPIQLSQVGVDYLGSTLAAVDATASVIGSLTRLDIGGAISSAAHGVYNTLQSSMPIVETSGANGSFLTPYRLTRISYHFYQIADEDIGHKGRPLCAVRTINTLSGYVLCADGEIDIGCTEGERSAIQNYLTSGFFWE